MIRLRGFSMCTINTAQELFEMMHLGCYTVEINDGMLEVSPAFAIDEEMTSLIKLHKSEIIKIIQSY